MSEQEPKAKPKGVDLVQMEEDMENSRMDRTLSAWRNFPGVDQPKPKAKAAGNPPPRPAR